MPKLIATYPEYIENIHRVKPENKMPTTNQ